MKAFVLFLVLLSQVAMADTYSYQLFYDEDKTEALDIKVEVVLSGKFNNSSKVNAVKVYGIEKKKTVLLFNIPAKLIKAKWKGKNVLSINTGLVNPLIKGEYIAIHSDTNINHGEDYDLQMVINENGTLQDDLEGLFMGNQTVEEM
jgi:hypothetical protein